MSSDAKSSLGLWSGELTIYKSMCNNKINTRYVHLCTITDRGITLLSDTDISFGLFNLFTYFDMPFG
jgi:hypothetical protein